MPPLSPELRLRIADLYAAYAEALDDGALERWPDFFTADCVYKVVSRANLERRLPLAIIYCESRAMLQDRVVALRQTALYVPRLTRRLIANIRPRRGEDGSLAVRANFAIHQSLPEEPVALFLTGEYRDRLVEEAGALRFAEKICVHDGEVIPTSLVIPI
jgi:anthranilate 1,2-dioxygenase small subunit